MPQFHYVQDRQQSEDLSSEQTIRAVGLAMNRAVAMKIVKIDDSGKEGHQRTEKATAGGDIQTKQRLVLVGLSHPRT